MRISLIYPPPWIIPAPGEAPEGMPFGPPQDKTEHAILTDGDFLVVPYGVITIAAQAKRAGHDVDVFNLANQPWRDIETLIASNSADVFGISAFVANRRGMGAMAALIRKHHPNAHITAGGPFVTALPTDTLRYYREIDTAVIGEGENTFMALLKGLETSQPLVGIPGLATRDGEKVILGPPRTPIEDLDTLAMPFDYFTHQIILTSRGCPSKCTFCGSATTWGKSLRFHSVGYTLDVLKKALAWIAAPVLMIKDDTFTAHQRRALEICDTIIAAKLNFLWSCDSRVDSLTDDLLRKMRLAGCQVISLGVESGSPEILASIRKKTTPNMVLEATRLARKYGMYVRYYMILGNRGETPETIQQSINLIKAGRPNKYSFNPLAFYPGTEEWEILRATQGVTSDIFFINDFREPSISTHRQQELQSVMMHIFCDVGKIEGFDYTTEERETVVERLPDLHSVHAELANAYFRAGRLDDAERELDRAEALGFPILAILDNQRACIAVARDEIDNALTLLDCACRDYPHQLAVVNRRKLRSWAAAPECGRRAPPKLDDSVLMINWVPGIRSWTETLLADKQEGKLSSCVDDPRLAQAIDHQRARRMAEAMALFDALLTDYPGDPNGLHCFGMFCHDMGDDETASMLIELSITRSPHMPIAHASLGVVRASLGDYEGAVESSHRAIALAPAYVTAHSNLGGFLLALGLHQEASEAFRKTIELDPTEGSGYCGLGAALLNMADSVGAEAAFTIAIQLNPSDADAHRGLKQAQGR